jgi:hypothetical protein
MATSKSFAYNSGSPIAGTNQVGDLAISLDQLDYTTSPGGVQWWQGPDEDLGYVIAHTVPNDTQPTPVADYLYLDPSRLGNSAGLSNSNQTVQQQFGYIQSTLGTKLIGANDQVMFSVLVSLTEPATLANSHYIGIGTANMNYNGVTPDLYSAYPGNDDQSMGYRSDGTIWYNGSQYAAGLQIWGDDDVIDIVINNNVNGMWVRVNGGYWNNNATHNPETNVGGIEVINAPFYPVLCPGYQGTMTIQNSAAYGTPRNCKLFGDETAAVGFNRSTSLTEASFIEVANSISGQVFISGNAASTWLTDNGYWNNWSSFGSSGFQWMTISSVTSNSALGVGQNSIGITVSQSAGGMEQHTGMYSANTFPEEYGVPFDGIQILNQEAGTFTAIFSQPVTDPLVAFASVGNPGLPVPVQVSAPFTPIWETATTYQNAVGGTQYTQFTGQEGYNIIRIDGTVSIVSFQYTVSEYYCTVCFGFVDQNA